jgi:hypothetical protein
MNAEHLDAILKNAKAASKDGWDMLPEGSTMTLYVAHGSAPVTFNRIEALKKDGPLVFARSAKGEQYAFVRDDLFACALDGVQGKPERRAGF